MKINNNPSILFFGSNNGSIMTSWPKYHINDELELHKCRIYDINLTEYSNIDEANKHLLEFIGRNQVDLFVTSFNEKTLQINTLNTIKNMGVKTLLFCPDNLVIPYVHKNIAKYFDLVWLTSIETKYYFDKHGANTIYMPYAANPYMKYEIKSNTEGVCFIGTPYGSRANIINELTNNDINVYCTCKTNTGISNNGGNKNSLINKLCNIFQHVRFTQGRKLIIGSLINRYIYKTKLNDNKFLHNIQTVEITRLYEKYSFYSLCFSSTTAGHTGVLREPLLICNLRSFEIPMSGGVLFAQYNPELDSYFKDGVEAIYYYNKKDMIEKAKYYLDPIHRDELLKIKHNARKKAEKYHSWWVRYKKIFDLLSIEYIDN